MDENNPYSPENLAASQELPSLSPSESGDEITMPPPLISQPRLSLDANLFIDPSQQDQLSADSTSMTASLRSSDEFIAKYQVVKCSWRGKYERILALGPMRFCTIDPKGFEVTNTWSLSALIDVQLESGDPEGLTLNLKGVKKVEQLKLRCLFRAHLLSDLFRLRSEFLQCPTSAATSFSCTKVSRLNELVPCKLEIEGDGVTCRKADGTIRSKYLYVDMEHVTCPMESKETLVIGYMGRNKIFQSDRRAAIHEKIVAAGQAIGVKFVSNSQLNTENMKHARAIYGTDVGDVFVHFDVLKLTSKYNKPVERTLALHQKHIVELDTSGNVVSCRAFRDIYCLVRLQKSSKHFEIQFLNADIRRYIGCDRDGVLAAIYDLCVTCYENPKLIISSLANERGLKLTPLFSTEDSMEASSFFGGVSIGTSFLQRMSAVGKVSTGSLKRVELNGDRGFVSIVAEFNANVPASGIQYNTKHSVIADALRPLGAQLYYVSKCDPFAPQMAVTLVQGLCRIASSFHGFREIVQVSQMLNSITNLLVNGDELTIFWTTQLISKLTSPFSSITSDHVAGVVVGAAVVTSGKVLEEAETFNKSVLFSNTYLVQSLVDLLEGISLKDLSKIQESKKKMKQKGTPQKRVIGPLVIMGVLQTLESALCSRRHTTGPNEFKLIVGSVAKYHSTLVKILFRSRCATTVEASTLLLKVILEECDPDVASSIKEAALLEGIVLRHFYQAVFDDSFDQRCVSRYLISLWMSHYAEDLLSRLVPAGLTWYLKMPQSSPAEIQEMDDKEREQMSHRAMERDMARSQGSISPLRASMTSNALNINVSPRSDEVASAERENDITGDVHTEEERLEFDFDEHLYLNKNRNRSISMDERMDERKAAVTSSRRMSVGSESISNGKPIYAQIENDYTKARMLQKIQISVASSSVGPPANQKASPKRGRQVKRQEKRIRKRDVAYGLVSNVISKMKNERFPYLKRGNKSSQEGLLSMTPNGVAGSMENFRLFFYMLSQDHHQVHLIWNHDTREELETALRLEIQRFSAYQNNQVKRKAIWNYEDFSVKYPSLQKEVVIGDVFVRVLCDLVQNLNNSNEEVLTSINPEDNYVVLTADKLTVQNPHATLSAFYLRLLRENILAEYRDNVDCSLMCLKSISIIGAAYANFHHMPQLCTDFPEITHLITLIKDTKHASMLKELLGAIRSLSLFPPNAKRLAENAESVDTLVNLLRMGHLTSRYSTEASKNTSGKVWLIEDKNGEVTEPLSVEELINMKENQEIDFSTVWIKRLGKYGKHMNNDRFKIHENAQLRWEVVLKENIQPLQLAHDAVNVLLAMAHSNFLMEKIISYYPTEGSEVDYKARESSKYDKLINLNSSLFPPPSVKLSLWHSVEKIAPLLVRCETPRLSEQIAKLLEFLYSEPSLITQNCSLPSSSFSVTSATEESGKEVLYLTGLFFMIFMYNGDNFKPFAGLLKSTHLCQRLPSRGVSSPTACAGSGVSVLLGLLPEAMISLLSAAPPEEFARVFCSEEFSPEVIWNSRMRDHLRRLCSEHLMEYAKILEQDVTTEWLDIPMAPVTYSELDEEIWCGGVYLSQLCANEIYEIHDPLDFMTKLERKWCSEAARKAVTHSKEDILALFGLSISQSTELLEIRKGFKAQAKKLVLSLQENEIDAIEYESKLKQYKEAYRVLTCPRPSLLSQGHDPSNLLLVLKTLVTMCNRYPKALETYKFDCYSLLLPLLASHCSANGVVPVETTPLQKLQIAMLAAELLYSTCAVNYSNAEILIKHYRDLLFSLEKVVNYCVNFAIDKRTSTSEELLQICFYAVKTIAGLVASNEGREWILTSTTLFVDFVRILWFWNQTLVPSRTYFQYKLTQQVLESVSRMAQSKSLQTLLVDRGIIWQLFVLFSSYECDLEESEVRKRLLMADAKRIQEAFTEQHVEIENLLSIMSIRALCRLGGIFVQGSPFGSPVNIHVKSIVVSLMTPNLSNLLRLDSHHEYLKIFHSDCESYTLYWTASMRQELLKLVSAKAIAQPTLDTHEDYLDALKFRFEYVAEVLNIGGLFIETLVDSLLILQKNPAPAPVKQLGMNARFFEGIFNFIKTCKLLKVEVEGCTEIFPPYYGWKLQEESLTTVHRLETLNCLAIIGSVAPDQLNANITKNIPLVKLMLRLLFPPDNEVHEQDVELEEAEAEDEKDIVLSMELYPVARAHIIQVFNSIASFAQFGKIAFDLEICEIYIEVIHICPEVGQELLSVIQKLCTGEERHHIVKQILKSGCYLEFITWFAYVEVPESAKEAMILEALRVPCAQVLASMTLPNAVLTAEVMQMLYRFFPRSMAEEIVRNPLTSVQYYMADHEDPDLVWNQVFRNHLRIHVVAFSCAYHADETERTSLGSNSSVESSSIASTFMVDYLGLFPQPNIGNVYLLLYLKDPVFKLRNPKHFVCSLMKEFEVICGELIYVTAKNRVNFTPEDDAIAQRDNDLLYLITACLVCALRVYPWLLDLVAEVKFPESCAVMITESQRSGSSESCVINIIRIFRVITVSPRCVADLQRSGTIVLSSLIAQLSPRTGALRHELPYVLEIIRRFVLHYPDHGEGEIKTGIVAMASRLNLFDTLLNILENPEQVAGARDPPLIRALSIEILKLLEQDRYQAQMAHGILKKSKKWDKKYKHEPTDRTIRTEEDPFLHTYAPGADEKIRHFIQSAASHVHHAPSTEVSMIDCGSGANLRQVGSHGAGTVSTESTCTSNVSSDPGISSKIHFKRLFK